MPRATPSDRRERILDSAREEFAERGFAAARMEDIARRVGISRAALYLAFDSKEAMFRALVSEVITEMMPTLLPSDYGSLPAPALLRAFVKNAMKRIASPDMAFLPRLIVGEGRNFPELARFYHETALICVLGAVERLIIHGIDRGEFACADPKMAARSVAGGIIFAALWRNVFEPVGAEPLDVEWMAENHAGLILAGLRRGDVA
ncbi:transcriptional regulator, TetR family [Novosphingobium aromaticivorans DSM 12444]|uniref:Transcriptional regulator, TetR family n=1 Tax=Novosphingobium aromaticivorans (strain ATCC 700278 / DSM 12444 / CCUG 56034 / CIP 105152 / NBRC 16084 / F199) TaxID=279238 RepID=Q2G9J4_NOVAD|nr:TetR/AcrR family transcriptional regulator [Novosphingobium aromaticivorans]ABD25479.1 transcriptional regulator, TetR family [Novosphingobium aromaticivorans DSM 12444]SCX94907.1 transcriptional regulator, TetR family [Novosphingobium aromaticivorans]